MLLIGIGWVMMTNGFIQALMDLTKLNQIGKLNHEFMGYDN
jgi:hypothetical protein